MGSGDHGSEFGLIMRAVKSQFIVLMLLKGTEHFKKSPLAEE